MNWLSSLFTHPTAPVNGPREWPGWSDVSFDAWSDVSFDDWPPAPQPICTQDNDGIECGHCTECRH